MAGIKELRELERRELAAAKRNTNILRSLSRVRLRDDHEEQKAALRSRILKKQREYLTVQAELEKKIATVPNHYIRLALCLIYVDLLQYEAAAEVVGGGITGSAIQQQLARYFEKTKGAGRYDCPSIE